MPRTSSFIDSCPFPIYADTYAGCTHSCVYCYANTNRKGKRMAGADVKVEEADTYGEIKNFIFGKRTYKNGWADWEIPFCWGRNSDPFQPCERTEKKSLKILELLAEQKYPVIITTKGTMLAEEPYLSLLKECKAVVQMSLVCDKMDALEPNAPPFKERLEALKVISGVATRTIARMQPIFYEYRREALRNIEKFKDAGAYGILVGMPRFKKPVGACNEKNNFTYYTPLDKMIPTYEALRAEAHKHGLVFNASDLEYINDNRECCTCGFMEDFMPNTFNCVYAEYAPDLIQVTPSMQEKGSARVFTCCNGRRYWEEYKTKTFAEVMGKRVKKFLGNNNN